MMDFLTKQIRHNWKTFVISFIAVFAMVALPKLGLRLTTNNSLVSPQSSQNSLLKSIFDRLHLKDTTYRITTPSQLIKESYASGAFDQASAYAVIDFDSGQVLASKNLDAKLPIASLTKIMTAVVTLDLAMPSDIFQVSPQAAAIIPTKIGVIPGERMSVDELLSAAILTSANDAVQVLKDGINTKYNQDIFVSAMNDKANFLHLTQTHFTNPQGFDNPEHYSSVKDLAQLTHYALTNYPIIAKAAQTDYRFLNPTTNHKQFDLYNWNGLIDVYPNVEGVKIGNTDDAAYTTIVLSNRHNHQLLTIVLGAPGVLERDLWASQLLDLGYQQTLALDPVNVTENQLKAKYQTWKYWN